MTSSPVYRSVKYMSPARIGSRFHLWEELDELEYVAGDEERHTADKFETLEPDSLPPVTS